MNTKEKMFINNFNEALCDKNKWNLLAASRNVNYAVVLDNDETFVNIFDSNGEVDWSGSFSKSVGNSAGISSLLDSIGIRWERC